MNQSDNPSAYLPGGLSPEAGPPAPSRRTGGVRRSVKALALGAILLGASAGAVVLGPLSANAASPTASASAAPSTAPGSGTAPNHQACDGDHAPSSSSGSSSSSGTGA